MHNRAMRPTKRARREKSLSITLRQSLLELRLAA
jgi:hypothetical protein